MFPKCFTLEGEAKPLKIGIFQDLAERPNEDGAADSASCSVKTKYIIMALACTA